MLPEERIDELFFSKITRLRIHKLFNLSEILLACVINFSIKLHNFNWNNLISHKFQTYIADNFGSATTKHSPLYTPQDIKIWSCNHFSKQMLHQIVLLLANHYPHLISGIAALNNIKIIQLYIPLNK